jgi:hypothetical protein
MRAHHSKISAQVQANSRNYAKITHRSIAKIWREAVTQTDRIGA